MTRRRKKKRHMSDTPEPVVPAPDEPPAEPELPDTTVPAPPEEDDQ